MATEIPEATRDAATALAAEALHDKYCLSKASDWHTGPGASECIASRWGDAVTALAESAPLLIQAGREAERARIAAQVEPHAKRWLSKPSHPPVIGDVVWKVRQIVQGGTDGN